MRRKMLALPVMLMMLTTSIAAFAGASYALDHSDAPAFRSTLQVGDLATTPLTSAEALQVNNLLGESAGNVGITVDSYFQARTIGSDGHRDLWAIPGQNGACVVLRNAASCGDPGGAGQSILAVVQWTRDHELFGGGITTSNVNRVTLTSAGQPVASVPVVRGVFQIAQIVEIDPNHGLQFTVEEGAK